MVSHAVALMVQTPEADDLLPGKSGSNAASRSTSPGSSPGSARDGSGSETPSLGADSPSCKPAVAAPPGLALCETPGIQIMLSAHVPGNFDSGCFWDAEKARDEHYSSIGAPPGLEDATPAAVAALAVANASPRLPPGFSSAKDDIPTLEVPVRSLLKAPVVPMCPPAPPSLPPNLGKVGVAVLPPPLQAALLPPSQPPRTQHVPPPPPSQPPLIAHESAVPPPPPASSAQESLPAVPPPLQPPVLRARMSSSISAPPAQAPVLASEMQPASIPLPPAHAPSLHLDENVASPQLGALDLPSIGSQGHRLGACKPCAFVHTKGCSNGANCIYCHLCQPGEKKRRTKEKYKLQRAIAVPAEPIHEAR